MGELKTVPAGGRQSGSLVDIALLMFTGGGADVHGQWYTGSASLVLVGGSENATPYQALFPRDLKQPPKLTR